MFFLSTRNLQTNFWMMKFPRHRAINRRIFVFEGAGVVRRDISPRKARDELRKHAGMYVCQYILIKFAFTRGHNICTYTQTHIHARLRAKHFVTNVLEIVRGEVRNTACNSAAELFALLDLEPVNYHQADNVLRRRYN